MTATRTWPPAEPDRDLEDEHDVWWRAELDVHNPVTSYRFLLDAATKAFGAVLAEGLWAELRGAGVDVLACVTGAVATPGLSATMRRHAPGTIDPDQVAEAALRALGRGPRTVPGAVSRLSATLMSRVFPRRAAIALMASASRDLTPPTGTGQGSP